MSTRVFLSYARADDEPFVHRLCADLQAAGFTVWFDRQSLMARGLNFHQEIKDAIRCEVDRIVYVGGPKAAASAYVREEWQLGLEFDHIVVTPILRLGDYATSLPGELALLHCEDFTDDAKYPAALAKLIASLRQPNPKLGALLGVPTLPPHFLARPELMRRVRDALLVDLQTAQVITSEDARVGMQGMGGIGKSVLAAALARNREVRQSYPDGIVWISFGQHLTRDDLLSRLRDIVAQLGGDATFASLPQGQGVLRELLQAKAVLLVLDDVWRASDAKEFDQLGPRCRMLVTTRDAGILHTLHGELVPVSLFTAAEALQLLADATDREVSALPAEARAVADECGLLPLALALSGGMAKKRGGDFHSVLDRLRHADLDRIADRHSINEAHRSIWRAMQASVDMLEPDEQRRFAELAVFSADDTVPEAAVATLWEHTGSLDAPDTEELLINLAERSLIQLDQKPDTGAGGGILRRVGLHDLLHDYATRIAGEPKALHQSLLDAYRAKCPGGWASGPDDGYFFQQMRHHLIVLEHWDELCGYLTDFRCLDRRISAGQVFDVVKDHAAAVAALPEFAEEAARERERVRICAEYGAALIAYARECAAGRNPKLPQPPATGNAAATGELPEDRSPRAARLRAIANFTGQHATLLAAFLADFLPLAANAAADGPLTEAEALLNSSPAPWLRRSPRPPTSPLRPQCLQILQGHTGAVWSVALTPDGSRAVSGSGSFPWYDKTVRVWNLDSGQCLHILQGHTSTVNCVSLTPDGRRAVSGSSDNTLRVWDLESGQCLQTLQGHTSLVNCVSLTIDGRCAVSGSYDHTVRVWDLENSRCLHTLHEDTNIINSVGLTSDGRRAVSASGTSLRVWDLESGECLYTLQGHTSFVHVSLTPDGRHAVSSSSDKTLRVWDLESGQCLHTLEGHTNSVHSVSLTPDGRHAVSGSSDKTLRVWDLQSGQCLQTLHGHTDQITIVVLTPDGTRAVSGSSDKTLRVWDLQSGQCLQTLHGHTDQITIVVLSPDGTRAVSGSDTTLRIWELESGQCLQTLQEHTNLVTSVSLTPDGWLAVSGSDDNTLRVWELESGQCLAIYHAGAAVSSVAASPGGDRIVYGTGDGQMHFLTMRNFA